MKQNLRTLAGIFAVATIAVFAASCAKSELDTTEANMVGVKRTINASATLPQSSDKAYFDNATRKVVWENGDEINVNGTNVAISGFKADNTTAEFTSTLYALSSGGYDFYWAVYPTTLSSASSGSSIHSDYKGTTLTVNFPATQTYNSTANALKGNTYMAGYASVAAGTEWVEFQMRNLGAVLKLHLTADASAANKLASRIEFSTTNGALAGDFTISNASTPTVTPAATATKKLTVNLTDGTNNYIDLSSGADIYVILPPMASKNLTMTIYNTDNKQTNKTITSATLARNNIYTNTVNDLCFCECGGGSPYFSVSATQQVVFAPGNLQWSATNGGSTATTHATADGLGGAGTWRFAENQWDYIGDAAGNNTAAASRETQAAWIDLFGWGTSGYDNTANDPDAINYQPWATDDDFVTFDDYGWGPSTNMTDPSLVGTSANYDWGVYNAIYNPKTNTTDPAGTWRTPTADEWVYVLNTRTTCSGVRYAKATVNNVHGLIIVPDNWDVNTYALNGTNDDYAYWDVNTISSADWTNIFEPTGCVFLPAAGYRVASWGPRVFDAGDEAFYWSATYFNKDYASVLMFWISDIFACDEGEESTQYRYVGISVRLVKDM